MPTYTFLDTETDHLVDFVMPIRDLDQFKKDNPNLVQQVTAPMIHSGRGIGTKAKPDDAFRDKLKEIKKEHSKGMTKSTVNTF